MPTHVIHQARQAVSVSVCGCVRVYGCVCVCLFMILVVGSALSATVVNLYCLFGVERGGEDGRRGGNFCVSHLISFHSAAQREKPASESCWGNCKFKCIEKKI